MIRGKILMLQWKRLHRLTMFTYLNVFVCLRFIFSSRVLTIELFCSFLMILQFCSFIMMVVLVNGINLNGQRVQFMSVQGNKQNGIILSCLFFAFNLWNSWLLGNGNQLFCLKNWTSGILKRAYQLSLSWVLIILPHSLTFINFLLIWCSAGGMLKGFCTLI